VEIQKSKREQEISLLSQSQLTFRLFYRGNAFDFSRDLSSIVYSRPGGEADLYSLSQTP